MDISKLEAVVNWGETAWPMTDWPHIIKWHGLDVTPFLKKCVGEVATAVSHPESAGLRMDVGRRGGVLYALPRPGCELDADEYVLTEDEIQIWAIDQTKVAAKLAELRATVAVKPVPDTKGTAAGAVCAATGLHATVERAKGEIIAEVRDLRGTVVESLDGAARAHGAVAVKEKIIEEMAAGPDRFLSGLCARIGKEADVQLLLALLRKTDGETPRYLSYGEIGEQLGGITKQGVGRRVSKFRAEQPEAWSYADALRSRAKDKNFSELAPSERRARGVDESYNHDAE